MAAGTGTASALLARKPAGATTGEAAGVAVEAALRLGVGEPRAPLLHGRTCLPRFCSFLGDAQGEAEGEHALDEARRLLAMVRCAAARVTAVSSLSHSAAHETSSRPQPGKGALGFLAEASTSMSSSSGASPMKNAGWQGVITQQAMVV